MQGVEILNTAHSYASLISPIWALGFCLLGLLICIAGICTIKYDTIQKILFSVVGVVVAGIIICLFCSYIKTDEIIDTKYKVTISNEVSMAEFYEKYEVIEKDGEIFTVREVD